jgi:hypothetical protein
MIRVLLALALLVSIAAAARAQTAPPSLFFSEDEVATIQRLFKARETEAKARAAIATRAPEEPRPVAPDIYLGALLYSGPNDWAIWINGVKRTTRQRANDIAVVSVTPDGAELVWLGDPRGGPKRLQLRPYQTWVGATGEVLEGVLAAPPPAASTTRSRP